ncbi:MAG: glycosyltransferase family 9 protein [Nanoarchaeota archaeon]|nr:glycosyltransferase family 9 protein [Nanoarchaeota archaeon]
MKKILIIKLGALGDVVRTLPMLPAIKEAYPDSEIYWVTKPNATGILETHHLINRVFPLPVTFNEKFDILYNFDIEEDATQLAEKTNAEKKYGFYSEGGYASAFNLPAEYYLNTLFDDETKKTNKKTYQEMMFEAAELPYKKQHSIIYLTKEDEEYAENFLKSNSINKEKLIGIHLGAGPRWPSKAWAENKIKDFIIRAKEKGYEILLFAGADEKDKINVIVRELNNGSIKVCQNNPDNTIRQFASLVNLCKVVICSDSLALHVSIAMKKPTIALFFCTPPNEVESYGILKKLVSPMLYEFFPEKMDQFSEELVNSISVEEVLNSID